MRMMRRDTYGAQVLLMLMNSIANQGSILRWSRDHRVHHKVHFFPVSPSCVDRPHGNGDVGSTEPRRLSFAYEACTCVCVCGDLQHVDTPYDPHDATKGFWWSHVGWLIWRKVKRPALPLARL